MARPASEASQQAPTERQIDRPIPGALEWVRDHEEEYAGQWVAVGAHGLVAAGATFAELRSKLPSFDDVMISHVV